MNNIIAMTAKDRIEAQNKRIALVEQWEPRLNTLKETKGISQNKFCDIHKFDAAKFNRNKNLVNVPNEKFVKKVEKALAKEGV